MSNTRVYKSVVVLEEAKKIIHKELLKKELATEEAEDEEKRVVSPKKEALPPPDFTKEKQEVLAQARTEAQKITETAQVKAKDIEKKAYEKGFITGKQEGISEGQDLGRQEVKTVVEVLNRQITFLKKKELDLAKEVEENVVNLVLEITKKIILQEVKQNKSIVIKLAEEGIKRITERERLLIRVSKEDIEVLKEHREALLSCADGIKSIEFQEDGRVGSGGCIIETTVGTLDLRLESQLGMVAKAFEVMLEQETGKK